MGVIKEPAWGAGGGRKLVALGGVVFYLADCRGGKYFVVRFGSYGAKCNITNSEEI